MLSEAFYKLWFETSLIELFANSIGAYASDQYRFDQRALAAYLAKLGKQKGHLQRLRLPKIVSYPGLI